MVNVYQYLVKVHHYMVKYCLDIPKCMVKEPHGQSLLDTVKYSMDIITVTQDMVNVLHVMS
jgi:hypothetical protein